MYNNYLWFVENLTFERYADMMQSLYAGLFIMIGIAIFSNIQLILELKRRPDKATRKKLELIRKWKAHKKHEQVNEALQKYVEDYTRNNKINWDEYI